MTEQDQIKVIHERLVKIFPSAEDITLDVNYRYNDFLKESYIRYWLHITNEINEFFETKADLLIATDKLIHDHDLVFSEFEAERGLN